MKLSSLTLGFAAALFLAVCATPSFAESFYLTASSPATGSELDINPLAVSAGTITFTGEIDDQIDPDMIDSGAMGNNFDVIPSDQPGGSTASLSWDFDAYWVSFIYGGNGAGITITAYDGSNNVIDTFTEPNTYDSGAGPMTFSSGLIPRIRRLEWSDTGGNSFAALDNIEISLNPNPEPGTLGLMALAALGLTIVRRRRRKQA